LTEKTTPIDDYLSRNIKSKEKIVVSLERTPSAWEFTFPDGAIIELPNLKSCEKLIWHYHRIAQFRDIDYTLIDKNTGTKYSDYRKFTDYIEACQERQQLTKENRRVRAKLSLVRRKKPRKIDTRIFDRNY
tara:strand:- start:117 stop:509 length:393 start_codon:yes stop_codon:yes gene_type:complete